MPLRDHFRPPIGDHHLWEGLYGGWPMVIVQHLGRMLPDRYAAAPRVHLGPVEEGVATSGSSTDADEYAVHEYDVERGRQLVAAVRMVSPRNKHRPESRAQFVAGCAALLRQHVSIVIVDFVTMRSSNVYAELLGLIGEHDPALGDDPPATYATACRWRPRGVTRWLEAWDRPLVVGQPLPELPLWLNDEVAIPLDLEASYEQTCRDLRIP